MTLHDMVAELERLTAAGAHADIEAFLGRIQGADVSGQDPAVLGRLYVLIAVHHLHCNRLELSLNLFREAAQFIPKDLHLLYNFGIALPKQGTHKGYAESRDTLGHLLTLYPGFVDQVPPAIAETTLATLARCCSFVGPKADSVRYYQTLVGLAPKAEYYMAMTEELAALDRLEEAEQALRTAISLEPGYANRENVHTLSILDSERGRKKTVQRDRYPTTETFRGDLKHLIVEHIANEFKASPRFLTQSSKIFTMGSCFAANIARALTTQGYPAVYMPLSENINTSFANRYFVDWLKGNLDDSKADVAERIAEWMPAGQSRESILAHMRESEVFILTLGVAPAFFDRTTGEFVLPRPSHINSRALAEKYAFRTTTVEENVANVRHVLEFLRSLAPHARIFVTVSPVPLHITFEYKSAVVADCLSKSIMRVVAHEIVHNQGLSNIFYWPSFEVFRWAGSQLGPFYAADDGAAWHVSEDAVTTTVQSFIDLFGAQAPTQA